MATSLTAIALSDVLDQLKTVEEQLASLEARLSLQKQFLDNLLLLTLVELNENDLKQDGQLLKLEEHVSRSPSSKGTLLFLPTEEELTKVDLDMKILIGTVLQ